MKYQTVKVIQIWSLVVACICFFFGFILSIYASQERMLNEKLDSSQFDVMVLSKKNVDSGYSYVFEYKFKVTNNSKCSIDELEGYMQIYNGEDLLSSSTVTLSSSPALDAGMSASWTVTSRMENGKQSVDLWNTSYEELEIRFRIIKIIFSDEGYRSYLDTTDYKVIKASTSGNNSSGNNSYGNDHTHTYSQRAINTKYLNKAADCENAATYFYSCSCGAVGSETFAEGAPNDEHNVDGSGYCTICDTPFAPTEGIIYDLSVDQTYAEVVGYSGDYEKVIIASEYNGVPVKTIYDASFSNKSITSVIVPDSVTSIGERAFSSCTSLTSVTIGDSATSIGDSAFSSCTSLKSVTIPDSVTSIGNSAFSSCKSLTSVTIGDSVTSICPYAFRGCTSLTSVTIPDSVTSIGAYAFDGCNSELYTEYNYGKYVGDSENPYYVLIELTNKNFATYDINEDTKIIAANVFEGCARLSSIDIPDSVVSIGSYAFSSCTSLTSVTIPDSVTSIGIYAFYNCSSLTSVTIGDSVTSIGNYTFYDCSGLTSVTIGDSVESIGECAFYNCRSLTSVTIPDSVTSIGSYAFFYCDSLTDVYFAGSEEEWGTIVGYGAFKSHTTIHFDYVSE